MTINHLKECMKMIVQMMKKIPNRPLQWSCFEEIVLQLGQEFQIQSLPNDFEMGIPKYCFYNCSTVALDRRDVIYCEGFAMAEKLPFPILHAWLVRKNDDKIIELTCDKFDAYLGVPFQTKYLRKRWEKFNNSNSLFDDWENEFPLLNMTEQEIRDVIHIPTKGKTNARKSPS